MSPAGPPADGKPSRAEQRAREKAEWADHDALIKRLGELWPNYGCFCGTLEDLRETVADLERRAARTRPSRRSSARGESSADGDPQTAARLAVSRARQRLQHGHESGYGDLGAGMSRGQLDRPHARGATSSDVGGDVDD
ncbi:hypothetical protein [Actinomycetospora sp. NBC_00405]|uniref:hypothetical protein n=1 Tax=Actinomycetospora sp. NBC_00405 TaxID=2975952 RepID=UPI002E1EBA2E